MGRILRTIYLKRDKVVISSCANLVNFTVLPHFGREDTREKYLKHRCKHIFGKDYKIILLTDKQYVRVQEDGMYKIEEVDINQ